MVCQFCLSFQRTSSCSVCKRPRTEDIHRLKVKGWKKIFLANGHKKKTGVAIFISDKIDFKVKPIIRDKEDLYIILKRVVQQEDIALLNIYAPNIDAPKKKILETLRKIDSNTVIVGDFNSPLSTMDRSSKQSVNRILLH